MAFRQKSVDVHQFAMVPRAEIPRSAFRMQKAVKTTISSGFLTPIFCEEVLPGDSFNVRATVFGRLATPIFPFMDNLHLETFFFFVPNRLVWTNWVKFMGEQDSPADSISFTVPQIVSPAGGYAITSLFDYYGLPTVGQVGAGNTISHSALPLRGYNLIFNKWFRDENLVNGRPENKGDGPDATGDYVHQKRGKRHDYFTGCLPWTQKGTPVTMPLGTSAIVKTSVAENFTGAQEPTRWNRAGGAKVAGSTTTGVTFTTGSTGGLVDAPLVGGGTFTPITNANAIYPTNLYADLSTATAATINQIRQSFQIQKLLERDARGGTRYTEIVRSHFGVTSPDARLQRPEFLGGGHQHVNVNPVAQTSNTPVSGTAQGNLAAFSTTVGSHGFSYSATEHGYIHGFVCVRADLTYQQGLRRHWSRSTRYDFYFPAFAMLGEQAVLSKEIYADGSTADNDVFGYQERWAEYRYNPSEIMGFFRSTAASTIDPWHLAQKFTARPTLNSSFILESPPVQRVVAVGTGAAGQEMLLDVFYDATVARPMPLYSVPGLVDHF